MERPSKNASNPWKNEAPSFRGLDEERGREFYAIGLNFGYTEEEAEAFVAYMNGIVEITSMRSFFESMRPGQADPQR